MQSILARRGAHAALVSALAGGLVLGAAPHVASANGGSAPILGGTQGHVGDYPTVVAIIVGGGLCTGTLIDPEWVVTAAHCVLPAEVGASNQAQVTANTTVVFDSTSAFSGGTRVDAIDTIPNPGFNGFGVGDNDIGLIKLAHPITDRAPTPMNFAAASAPVGIKVDQVGYGISQVGNQNSAGRLFVVKDISTVGCSPFGESDTNLLCFNQTSGKGKCNGDSGGPSFATIAGKQVLVGITSFGDQNCTQFGADTRTDAEQGFVIQHVGAKIQCVTDGACAAACGQNGLPADPDCPTCEHDSDCGDGQACIDEFCQPEPFSDGGLGATCATGADCYSGSCAAGPGDEMKCTMTCDQHADDNACPSDFDCLSAGANGACWPNDDGGCCQSSTGSTPWGALLLGGMVLGVLGRRRTRH